MNAERRKMKDEMKSPDIQERLMMFSLRIVKLYASLPKNTVAQTLGKQLLRSGTSVGAQQREAHRARSDAEFISKLNSALQELDETSYWLELLVRGEVFQEKRLLPLLEEASQLTAIFVASIRTVHKRKSK